MVVEFYKWIGRYQGRYTGEIEQKGMVRSHRCKGDIQYTLYTLRIILYIGRPKPWGRGEGTLLPYQLQSNEKSFLLCQKFLIIILCLLPWNFFRHFFTNTYIHPASPI